MDDTYDFKSKTAPQNRESFAGSIPAAPVHVPADDEISTLETEQEPAAASSSTRKTKAVSSTRDDFTGPPAPLQVKIPTDMIQSLKLHSISAGKTMSELVFECLTSQEMLGKAWISTRRAA